MGSLLAYIAWITAATATGLSREIMEGCMVLALSLVVSYVRPCKSTLANFSLSYHTFMFGVFLFGVGYWDVLFVKTEALELTFIIIPLLSHIFVFSWMIYTMCRYVRVNVLSQNSLHHRITLKSDCRQCFCWRNCNGYQELPDSVSMSSS